MKKIINQGNDLYWKRIQLISFILAVFILIRHNSSFSNYDSDRLLNAYFALKFSITEIAVPLFFIISGFNFFINFSISSYKKKFTNRCKSLIIPYFVWNSIYCIFCIIISNEFFSQFFIGREKYILSPINIITGCLFHSNCNSHFWFVFELIVCVLLNPLIYLLLKNKVLGITFLSVLSVIILLFHIELPSEVFYRTDAFLYYYLGSFLGLHFKNFFMQPENYMDKRKTTDLSSLIVGVVFLSLSSLLYIFDLHAGIRFLIILLSSYGLWLITVYCKYFKFIFLPNGGTTFLLYAIHGIIQPIIVKILFIILPKYSWIAIINFILSIAITLGICVSFRFCTKKFFPIVDKVLTGWRR